MTTKKSNKKFSGVINFKNKLGREAEKIKDDIPFRKYVVSAILLNVATIFAVFILRNNLPPEIPLFYGLPEGQEQLAKVYLLALPSFISLGIIFLNIIIGILIKEDLLIKILILTGIASVFFSFVTTLRIMLLVGNF